MPYEIENLSLKSLEKMFLVLDDIHYNMEIQNKTSWLDMGRVAGINGVPKIEHRQIMQSLLENTDFLGEIPYGGGDCCLDVKVEKFNEFLQKISDKIAELKKDSAIEKNLLTGFEKCSWKDIAIKFKNEYDITISTGDKRIETGYAGLGFADKRKDVDHETKTKESWKLLHLFAAQGNVFPLGLLTGKEKTKRKKQKQELSKLLKTYFHIKEDPIDFNKEKDTYQIKLKLIPEEVFRNQWEDNNIFDTDIM